MTESNLQDWLGRQESTEDTLRAQPARFLQATLDREPDLTEGDALPPLWHWLYFLEARRASELGRDAHPKKGGFLPPVSLPRRMWAGGRFHFDRPLILGRAANKRSTIASITEKEGRSGKLCFVTVRHALFQDGAPALTEEHDIVYREDPAPDAPAPAPAPAPDGAEFSRRIAPTEVMLFRYSALTFNGHRIHYDVDYARTVEGYDGLVFHGPLTATLLADLACAQAGRPLRAFSFRGLAPIAGPAPFDIEGRAEGDALTLWARRADGALAMRATAEF
ncbi:MaoC family dehydratase N-terminal domain-containing protein [Ruegeria sp. 1NDH52C]|uniref:MaoC family dehydratase N-terminal domain-containing protein n=1 Tax=Ruegeria alba TaxID=2916756 RepID=A0ABS9P3N7_9RHOB|nr:MaoC family dehydratase N-terminal domain-containing protein [Ruegeria alba]MCG6560537.1 MaoC family dehydratase N-terminal domain-containing protein [Ruegeria alba]